MRPLLRILVFLPIAVFVLVSFVAALAVEATRDVTLAVVRNSQPERAMAVRSRYTPARTVGRTRGLAIASRRRR
jgi:hypothetical protein